jgi:Na+-translocating ferredoxin:NAD+ oxidoreductase RnfG subunit
MAFIPGPAFVKICLKMKALSLVATGRTLIGTLLFWTIGAAPPTVSAQIYMTPEAAVAKLMPEAEKVVTEHQVLTPDLKDRLEKVMQRRMQDHEYTFYIGMKGGSPSGYGVVLDIIGRERPITFMVVINPEGTVRAVEVLVYRESQGSEIRSPSFMRQFEGKTIQSRLRLGGDIDVISGATLSSRASAYVVKKALALVDLFYKQKMEVGP